LASQRIGRGMAPSHARPALGRPSAGRVFPPFFLSTGPGLPFLGPIPQNTKTQRGPKAPAPPIRGDKWNKALSWSVYRFARFKMHLTPSSLRPFPPLSRERGMYYAPIFRKQAPPLCLAERGPGGEVLLRKTSPPPFGHPLSANGEGGVLRTHLPQASSPLRGDNMGAGG